MSMRPELFLPADMRENIKTGASFETRESVVDDNDFPALPPQQKMRHASVILLAEYKPENGRLKAVGQVVFLTGNPARLREAYSYSNNRVDAFGDMSLETLRDLVRSSS